MTVDLRDVPARRQGQNAKGRNGYYRCVSVEVTCLTSGMHGEPEVWIELLGARRRTPAPARLELSPRDAIAVGAALIAAGTERPGTDVGPVAEAGCSRRLRNAVEGWLRDYRDQEAIDEARAALAAYDAAAGQQAGERTGRRRVSVERLADELLEAEPFDGSLAASSLPTWKDTWPRLRVDTWDWGETHDGEDRLELYVTVGECTLMLGEYSGGSIFDQDTLQPADLAGLVPETEEDDLAEALAELRRTFESAVDCVLAGLANEIRVRAVAWLDRIMESQEGR